MGADTLSDRVCWDPAWRSPRDALTEGLQEVGWDGRGGGVPPQLQVATFSLPGHCRHPLLSQGIAIAPPCLSWVQTVLFQSLQETGVPSLPAIPRPDTQSEPATLRESWSWSREPWARAGRCRASSL